MTFVSGHLVGEKNGKVVGIPSNIAVNVAEEAEKLATVTSKIGWYWTQQTLRDNLMRLIVQSG